MLYKLGIKYKQETILQIQSEIESRVLETWLKRNDYTKPSKSGKSLFQNSNLEVSNLKINASSQRLDKINKQIGEP